MARRENGAVLLHRIVGIGRQLGLKFGDSPYGSFDLPTKLDREEVGAVAIGDGISGDVDDVVDDRGSAKRISPVSAPIS